MLNGSGIRINKLSYKRKEIEREEYSCTQGCSSPSFFVSGRQAKYAENNPCHSIVTTTVTALLLASGEKGHSGSGKKGQLVVG